MPFKEVELECNILFCLDNDSRECISHSFEDELSPDTIDCAWLNVSKHFNISEYKFSLRDMFEMIKGYEVPFISLNENSSEFNKVKFPGVKFGLVQGSESDFNEFSFWKSVDGGFGCTHKDQMELKI